MNYIGQVALAHELCSQGITYAYDLPGRTYRVWGDVPQPVEIDYDATYGERKGLILLADPFHNHCIYPILSWKRSAQAFSLFLRRF